MKILLINNYGYVRGGAEVVFFNLTNLLKSKGHEVKLFSKFLLDDDSSLIDFEVKESQFFFNRFYSIRSKHKISEVLDSFSPDIVHINNIIGGITFSILPEIKKRKIPIVASVHDFRLLCPVGIFLNGKKEICEECKVGRYYKCILNRCNPEGFVKNVMIAAESYLRDFLFPHKDYFDKYLFVSQFTKNKFLEFYPDLDIKSEVLYNFTNDFNYNIKRGKYFLYFGRLDREKGIFNLINVFKELKNYELIILGKGEYSENLNKIDAPNIKYLGFKKGRELQEMILNSQYVVIPSECYETQSMAAVESFAMSKPIIASNLGGLVEMVDKENNGFLFEPRNYDSLKETIIKANNISDENYFRLSNNAFKFASENFNSENYYNKLISIYNSVLEN